MKLVINMLNQMKSSCKFQKNNIGCVWNTSYNDRSSKLHKFKPLLSAWWPL